MDGRTSVDRSSVDGSSEVSSPLPLAELEAQITELAGHLNGCTHQRYVDAHHIEHWADGGETKLSNLVTLCRLHHRLVHEGEIMIETPPGGGWRFLHPDGRHFEVIRCTHTPTYDGDELEQTHAELGIDIDPDTAATRWRGERMDYELGVWVLCNQAIRAREEQDVSAETSDEENDVSAEADA
jgi:hypothetical protein